MRWGGKDSNMHRTFSKTSLFNTKGSKWGFSILYMAKNLTTVTDLFLAFMEEEIVPLTSTNSNGIIINISMTRVCLKAPFGLFRDHPRKPQICGGSRIFLSLSLSSLNALASWIWSIQIESSLLDTVQVGMEFITLHQWWLMSFLALLWWPDIRIAQKYTTCEI